MNKKLIPTQDALAEYSILVKLDERGVEGLKKEPRKNDPKNLKTHIQIR